LASNAEAKKSLTESLLLRFKSFGVQEIVLMSCATGSEDDYVNLHDAICTSLAAVIDPSFTISRAQISYLTSLMVPSSSFQTPQILLSSFAKPEREKLLQWARASGVISSPIPGGVVCSNLMWSLGCLEAMRDFDSSVFGLRDVRALFMSDALSDESRMLAVHLLETTFVIVNTGWLKDQWIMQTRSLNMCLSARFMHFLAHPQPGAFMLTRVYRITSPIVEVSVTGLIRKLFLQTAGVLSDISAVSETGFSGTLLLKDVAYAVRLSVERTFALTVGVDMHSDTSGQVIHMVTSAIERGLDEERVVYERFYLNESKNERSLDDEIARLFKAQGRQELTPHMASDNMRCTPDLKLLGSSRLFWNELVIEGVIGKGSFGEVSLATIRETKKKIAVKKIHQNMEDRAAAAKTASLREILHELWVLSVLRHPNIVAPAGVCLHPLAVCMEFLELGDLRQFLEVRNGEDIPWHVRHSLMMDIASGMDYAHSQRPPLVHSDLKSPNILLCANKGSLSAKIADLGLASFSSINTAASVDNPLVRRKKKRCFFSYFFSGLLLR
jgi:hypothetical protein